MQLKESVAELASPGRVASASVSSHGRAGLVWLWHELVGWLAPCVLVPYLVTRLALLLVGEVASLTIPWTLGSIPATPPQAVAWESPLLRLDAQWYLKIAADWYQYDPGLGPRIQQSEVFFPLYPALIRIFNAVFAGGAASSLPASALIVANLSALVGLAALYQLVRREFSAPVAQRTVWYLLAFPVSFSLSAAYAEPVFLLACVLAIYAARSQSWMLAGVAGAAAALTRPYGVLIVVPLVLEFARTRWRNPGTLVQLRALALLLPVVALAGWMVYMYRLSGDFLLFGHMQLAWDNQKLTSPLATLLTGYGRTRDQQLQGRVDIGSLQFAVAALAVVATLVSWRTLPLIYATLATAFCLAVLSSGSFVSIWRHVFLIFPLFIVVARGGASAIVDRTYLSMALVGSGLMMILLVTNWAMVS